MTQLRQWLQDYLGYRQATGNKQRDLAWLLNGFLATLEARNEDHVTSKTMLLWVTSPDSASPGYLANRCSAVRGFARYLHLRDPRNEIPPHKLVVNRSGRPEPYLFSDEDFEALRQAILRAHGRRTRLTYGTLIGLLDATGMRVGEALALEHGDFDWKQKRVVIRHGKFGKSRELPLHSSTVDALRAYARERDQIWGRSHVAQFFIGNGGKPLRYSGAVATFHSLIGAAGLAQRSPRRPHMHDLRHTFAVRLLRRFYADDGDVGPRLAALAVYLGHVSPSSTYRYLSADLELFAQAARRCHATRRVSS